MISERDATSILTITSRKKVLIYDGCFLLSAVSASLRPRTTVSCSLGENPNPVANSMTASIMANVVELIRFSITN
jgi:hypothetical protein